MCILLCMTGVGSQLGLTPFLFYADGTAKPVKAIFVPELTWNVVQF